MTSVNGFFVEPVFAAYSATKAAIFGLTKAVAIDHGKEGVRANSICPGYIDSEMPKAYFVIRPDPVAAFLVGCGTSFVTGAAVTVNGGFSSGFSPTG